MEDMSGEIQCVEVSAEDGRNIDKLLDSILVQSEILIKNKQPDICGSNSNRSKRR